MKIRVLFYVNGLDVIIIFSCVFFFYFDIMEGNGNSNKSTWTQVAKANAEGWTTVTKKTEKKQKTNKKKESKHSSEKIETKNNRDGKQESGTKRLLVKH